MKLNRGKGCVSTGENSKINIFGFIKGFLNTWHSQFQRLAKGGGFSDARGV
jgi:hypothetical protein